jgi:hypothetical protein
MKYTTTLSMILKIISCLGLAFTIIPSFFVFKGVIDIKVHYQLMIVGMIMWFGTAPFWMKSSGLQTENKSPDEKEQ